MSDFPGQSFPPRYIPIHSQFCGLAQTAGVAGLSLSSAFSQTATLSQAYAIPFGLPWPYPVRRVFWANGSDTTGNTELGIYSKGLTKIYTTGSTAQSGASGLQFVACDILLSPGLYWLAVVNTGGTLGTNRFLGTSISTLLSRQAGAVQMASASPLPSTITAATWTAGFVPIVGFTSTDS